MTVVTLAVERHSGSCVEFSYDCHELKRIKNVSYKIKHEINSSQTVEDLTMSIKLIICESQINSDSRFSKYMFAKEIFSLCHMHSMFSPGLNF